MREGMRWERHCGEGRVDKRERCRAIRGSDVVAIVMVVDQENVQVVISLFVHRRCFISMIDLRCGECTDPTTEPPPPPTSDDVQRP